MSALAFLVPTSLVLGLIGLGCFIWSLWSRQYEDLDGAAERILLDDEAEGPELDCPSSGFLGHLS
jgi:cbb3-type cytochrome oxidase maturation protein